MARDKVHQADKAADKASGDWPQFAGILKGCTVLCCAAVLQCLRLPFSKPSGQASPFWTEIAQFEDPVDSKLDLGIMQSSNMLIKRQHLDKCCQRMRWPRRLQPHSSEHCIQPHP